MTKADLVEEIAKDTGLSKKDTSVVVNLIIENICKALAEGDKVELRGFGSFTVKNYKPYIGRNPKTGVQINVPSKKLPFFKVGKELKEMVDGLMVMSWTPCWAKRCSGKRIFNSFLKKPSGRQKKAARGGSIRTYMGVIRGSAFPGRP